LRNRACESLSLRRRVETSNFQLHERQRLETIGSCRAAETTDRSFPKRSGKLARTTRENAWHVDVRGLATGFVLHAQIMPNVSVLASFLTCIGLFACGGSQSSPETPSEAPPSSEPAPAPSSAAGEGARPQLTAEACEASGGGVVGDIGDGAIHRPDYRCPSGKEPSGSIRAPEGGPVAVEGSVCCPK